MKQNSTAQNQDCRRDLVCSRKFRACPLRVRFTSKRGRFGFGPNSSRRAKSGSDADKSVSPKSRGTEPRQQGCWLTFCRYGSMGTKHHMPTALSMPRKSYGLAFMRSNIKIASRARRAWSLYPIQGFREKRGRLSPAEAMALFLPTAKEFARSPLHASDRPRGNRAPRLE